MPAAGNHGGKGWMGSGAKGKGKGTSWNKWEAKDEPKSASVSPQDQLKSEELKEKLRNTQAAQVPTMGMPMQGNPEDVRRKEELERKSEELKNKLLKSQMCRIRQDGESSGSKGAGGQTTNTAGNTVASASSGSSAGLGSGKPAVGEGGNGGSHKPAQLVQDAVDLTEGSVVARAVVGPAPYKAKPKQSFEAGGQGQQVQTAMQEKMKSRAERFAKDGTAGPATTNTVATTSSPVLATTGAVAGVSPGASSMASHAAVGSSAPSPRPTLPPPPGAPPPRGALPGTTTAASTGSFGAGGGPKSGSSGCGSAPRPPVQAPARPRAHSLPADTPPPRPSAVSTVKGALVRQPSEPAPPRPMPLSAQARASTAPGVWRVLDGGGVGASVAAVSMPGQSQQQAAGAACSQATVASSQSQPQLSARGSSEPLTMAAQAAAPLRQPPATTSAGGLAPDSSPPAEVAATSSCGAGTPQRPQGQLPHHGLVVRSSGLAKALPAFPEPPRKKPRLAAGEEKEWDAEYTRLSSWMEEHFPAWRMHCKRESGFKYSEQQADFLEKYLASVSPPPA